MCEGNNRANCEYLKKVGDKINEISEFYKIA